ncbi:MAG: hypothetical protein V3T58_01895 [Candidatus Hydrothermarchaeales archaeon]
MAVVENQERVYELIYNSKGISKGKLKNELELIEDELKNHLDTLYRYGFIDLLRGEYAAVEEEMILETYLERNVDLHYLREAVDSGLVASMMQDEFGGFIEEIKSMPTTGLDWKIAELERKVKILSYLYNSFRELKKVR